jgi:hypothetical protein
MNTDVYIENRCSIFTLNDRFQADKPVLTQRLVLYLPQSLRLLQDSNMQQQAALH